MLIRDTVDDFLEFSEILLFYIPNPVFNRFGKLFPFWDEIYFWGGYQKELSKFQVSIKLTAEVGARAIK